jgi:vancomycin resistance protein YoaR
MSRSPSFPHFTLTQKISSVLFFAAIVLICIGVSSLLVSKRHYSTTFYPGVVVDDIPAGGRTPAEVEALLKDKHGIADGSMMIAVEYGQIKIASNASQLKAKRNYQQVLQEAYGFGRNNFLSQGMWQLTIPQTNRFTTELHIDPQSAENFISIAKNKINVEVEPPAAVLQTSQNPNSLKINLGKDGLVLNEKDALQKILDHNTNKDLVVTAEVSSISAQLSEAEIAAAAEKAKKLVGKQILFRADNVLQKLNDQELIALLSFPTGLSEKKFSEVATTWKKGVDRQSQSAVLEYDHQTLKVSKFLPPRKGLELDEDALKQEIEQAIAQFSNNDAPASLEVKLPVKESNPEVALDKTNDLGIKERIGFGESEYFHSIPGRIHNVALTASRINNTIVKPGEEFSFNNTLGDVSAATGFKPAYVIRNGKTELGDGGGVCQVSTTLFRALLNAGLPITKRHAHSYRVSYYELNSKPGVDATVYSGDVDLRFINDTGHYLLIHTEANSEKLYMNTEIYGTSDGRTAQIVDHITWDARPAPPALYVDDPTIPRGRLKQIDFAASGIKAKFKNIVKDKDGKVIREDEYVSNYVPWRAVFLRGV